MDSMSLTLPAKSDYVLALRLFISGVAARTDMHVEDTTSDIATKAINT